MDHPLEVEASGAGQPLAADRTSDRNIMLAAKGGGIVFAGQIVALIAQILFGVIVARFLGAHQFGLYKLGASFTGLLALFALLGLQAGMVRYVAIYRQQKDQARLRGVIQIGLIGPGLVGLMLGLLLFLLAGFVANQVFHNPELTPILRLFSLNIPLTALVSIAASITQGFKNVQYIVYARNLAARWVKIVMVAVLLVMGFGVLGVVATQLMANTIALVLLLYFLHKSFPLSRPLRPSKGVIDELMRFSLPVYASGLLMSLGGTFEGLVLGFFGMTAGVGIFAAAGSLSSISKLFHSSLGTIATPIFAELYDRGKNDQLKVIYQSTTKWAVTFSLVFFVTVLFFGEALLSIFGKEFKAGAFPLIILASGSFVNALTGQSGSMINMIGRSKVSAINSFLYLMTTLVIDFLLIPRWGVLGAALAASLTVILINLLRMVEVYFFVDLWPFNWGLLKPLMAGIAAAGVGYTISQSSAQFHPILLVVLGIVAVWGTYGLVIIILKFSPEDRLILDKLGRRVSRLVHH